MSCYEIYNQAICHNLSVSILAGGALAALYWMRVAYRRLFNRRERWQRCFDRAERERRKYTGEEIQEMRDKARRRL